MKNRLHSFTMQDSFNTPMDVLYQYAQDAMTRNDFMFWDETVADVIIDSIELEGLPVQKDENTICYNFVVYGKIVSKFEERLVNLQKDCKTILEHPTNNGDLLNIVLREDVPEVVKFALKVDETFGKALPEGTGPVHDGYIQAILDLRKEIYGL